MMDEREQALRLQRQRTEADAILRERGLPLPTDRREPAATTNESPVTLGHNWMTSQLGKD